MIKQALHASTDNLVWLFGDDGSFTCGDAMSRVTSYSYPTSPNASAARKGDAHDLAQSILKHEAEMRCGMAHEAEYDARNWARIDAAFEA